MEQIAEKYTDPEQMVVSILKEELAQLPLANYPANIVTVDTEEEVSAAAADLAKERELGFDTETKPCFKRGISNKVALLQLSTHTTCYLIRLNKIGLPPEIKAILENPDILKIGVSIHDDFHQMHKMYELEPAGFIDLQAYVKDFDIIDNSLARIYAILFDKRISKNQRLTNWEADKLTINQREYAALDALACIQIYDYLNTGNFVAGKSKYFRKLEEVRPVQQPLPMVIETTSSSEPVMASLLETSEDKKTTKTTKTGKTTRAKKTAKKESAAKDESKAKKPTKKESTTKDESKAKKPVKKRQSKKGKDEKDS